MVDVEAVARRIREARLRKGLRNSAELAMALRRRSGTKKPADETVRLWETASHIPPYDMVDLLSIELDAAPEYLLFGIQHDGRLNEERFLEYVSADEMMLLKDFRRSTRQGRVVIRDNASTVAKQYPAEVPAPPRAVKKKIPL
jgi:transcriptional regulator with XRE-family HTH domain